MIPRYHPQLGWRDWWAAPADCAEILREIDLAGRAADAFWFDSGTTALTVMLEALDLPADSGVLVAPYACVSVFEAIAAAGYRCVFVDICEETFTWDRADLVAKAHRAKAAVLIHTFGYPTDIAGLKKLLGEMPIIEDCSHGLGSRQGAEQIGQRGVGGVYSFNLNKPISAGGGGLLVLNDAAYKERLSACHLALQEHSEEVPARASLRLLARAGLFRPWPYTLAVKLGLISLAREGASHTEVEKRPLASRQLSVIASVARRGEGRWQRQRVWASEVAELLGGPSPLQALLADGEQWNGYLCPVLWTTKQERDAALHSFWRQGVDAFLLWPECLISAARFGYQTGDCGHLETALERLMFIPCYAELTERQKRRIARAIERWQQSSSTLAKRNWR